MDQIVAIMRQHRFDLTTEKAAQAGIQSVLLGANVEFTRERRLSPGDIPDFFLPAAGIAIEVKMKGAVKMAVFRQLVRYAAHDDVREILLVTNLAMGLPAEIGGKPAHYLSLGRAWL